MLGWAAVFFDIGIIAAVFGFGGIAAGAAGIAKILFSYFFGTDVHHSFQIFIASAGITTRRVTQ